MWIDTHSHLNDETFEGNIEEVVARMQASSIEAALVVGIDAATSQKAIQLTDRFTNLYAVVGIQPNSLTEEKADDWQSVQQMLSHPKVVALGETGLDRYWKVADFDRQICYFYDHLRLAKERQLPVVIHCREAEADVIACLSDFRTESRSPISGVMHSFTGDAATAAKCLELGLHISFAGMVTYKKNDDLRAVARTIPADRILVETDSPYLSPHPLRGKTNEPGNVVHTGACLAELRGVPVEVFARQTTANAKALFRI